MTSEITSGQVLAVHVWPSDAAIPQPVDDLVLDLGGPVGDRHYGVTMRSDVRQRWLYAEGTEIRNNRQISIVDADELAQIATNLGIDALAPGTIADNICTSGITGLTVLPPMSRLVFADPADPASDGAVVVLGGENMPCTIAGALVTDRYGPPPEKFPKAAIHLRGVTGWVERPGVVRAGLAVRALPPRPAA
jgi:hypothetical protein